MKKNLIILFFLASAWSCQEPPLEETSNRFSLKAAKEHYRELVSQGSLASDRYGELQNMELLWNRAYYGIKYGMESIEVPVIPGKVKLPLYNLPQDNLKIKPDGTVLKYTSVRLMFYKGNDGLIKEKFLAYMPDKEYLVRRKNEVVLNRIGKMQSDFKGYVEHSDLGGNAISVERFAMGKLVRSYSLFSGKAASGTARTAYCYSDCVPVEEIQCQYIMFEGMTSEPVCETVDAGCEWVEFCNDPPPPPPPPPGDGGNNGGSGAPPDIINTITDSCLKGVTNNLKNKNLVNDINTAINNIFNENSGVNLILNENSSQSVPARTTVTHQANPFNVTISFNPSLLSASSKEYIAATVYHEAIHAYLNADPNNSRDQLEQHVQMAYEYIGWLTNALHEVFPGMQTNVANGLALRGLRGVMNGNPSYWNELINNLGFTSTEELIELTDQYRDGTAGTSCD